MKKKIHCYSIINFKQAETVIKLANKNKIKPIIFIKYYIVSGFGVDWIKALISLLSKSFTRNRFKLYVDCGLDNGLCISMAKKKINYIKLRSNAIILSKIKNIADKNKVLLNPSFNIVDCRNTKNINLKLKKLYSKEKNENRWQPS